MDTLVWFLVLSVILIPLLAGLVDFKNKKFGVALSVLVFLISGLLYVKFRWGASRGLWAETTYLSFLGEQIFSLSRANLLFCGIHSLILLAIRISIPKAKCHLHRPLFLMSAASNALYLFNQPLYQIPFWILLGIPLLQSMPKGSTERKLFSIYHYLGSLLFAIGMTGVYFGSNHLFIMICLISAILIRQGLFPFHTWVFRAFEAGEWPLWISFFTAQTGAFYFNQQLHGMIHLYAQNDYPYLPALTLFSGVYVALMAQMKRNIRTVLGCFILSQSSFIFTGFDMREFDGIAGGILHFSTLAFGLSGMILAFWHLERRTKVTTIDQYYGHYTRAPILANLFLMFGLCCVGLPLTLGYITEDILFHSVIQKYPIMGLAMIFTTAMNGTSLIRLYFHLFYGTESHERAMQDLQGWEKKPLYLLLFILLIFGVAPKYLIIEHGFSPDSETIQH